MEKKSKFRMNKPGMMITIVLVLAIAALLIFSKVNVTVDDQSVHIKSSLDRITVNFEDVERVEKLTSLSVGSRVMGADLIKMYSGTFKNEPYGRYKLFAYKDIKEYILIEHEGGFIVLNQETLELTNQLYETISSKFSAQAD
jgi:hypothetical protein